MEFDLQTFLIEMKRDLQDDIRQNGESIKEVNGTVREQGTRLVVVETRQKWTLRGLYTAGLVILGELANSLHMHW